MTGAAVPVSPGKRKRRLDVLRRRADHLDQRVVADPNRPTSYDIRESKALRWAISELEAMDPQHNERQA